MGDSGCGYLAKLKAPNLTSLQLGIYWLMKNKIGVQAPQGGGVAPRGTGDGLEIFAEDNMQSQMFYY